MYGRWTLTAIDYAKSINRYVDIYSDRLQFVAPQDWMCEPIVIHGGKASRGVVFHGTGLTVEEHQRRTVSNFIELRGILGDIVIPVLQGWEVSDYFRCCEMYYDAGINLRNERTVGVGTVCRRQSTRDATDIMHKLSLEGMNLHGFGFKKGGLLNCKELLFSADSAAWSDAGRRRISLPGHNNPGPGRPRGHKNCANCAEWAIMWREEMLSSIEVHCAS